MTIDEAAAKKNAAIDHYKSELKKLRTGRASATMLDSVQVEVYGQQMPLNHVATVKVVDAQLIQIQPFDPTNLEAISASIRNNQSLGLNPADDGKIVRVPIPAMTEERRRDVVKQLHAKAEEAQVAMRNIRQDALNTAKTAKNDGDISEDDHTRIQKQVADLLDEFKKEVDTLTKEKETDIMSV